jgi:WD40 repeat protein
MNSLSYQVLSHFLAMNDLALIASIINDKIHIQILSTTFSKTNHLIYPSSKDPTGEGDATTVTIKAEIESNMLIQLPGYTPMITRSSMFAKELLLGVPGTGILVKGLLDMFSSPLFRNLLVPDGKKDLYKFYIDKLIRPRYLLQKIKDRKVRAMIEEMELKKRGVGTNIDPNLLASKSKLSIEDDLWTPLYTPSHNPFPASSASSSSSNAVQNKEDGEETRPNTSSSATSATHTTSALMEGEVFDPSVIFATIGNTYEGMTCMDINPSITQVVTGHADSIVRCWRLDEQVPGVSTGDSEEDRRRWFGQSLPRESGYRWELYDILPKTKDAFVSQMLEENTRQPEGPYYPPSKLRRGNEGIASSSSSSGSMDMLKYPRIELIGHRKPVYSVTQNETGRWIWSSSADETIRLWDASVVQCVQKYRCYSIAWQIASNPLDYYFLAGNADATVTLYSVDRVTPLRMFTGHASDVTSVTWHPNYSMIASGSDDRSIRLWDIRTAECVRIWQDTGSSVTSMSIAPSGNLLLAGTEQGNIHLYDIRSTRKLGIYYVN